MPSFSLRFFGPGLVVGSRGLPAVLRSRKQLALLVYLAVEHQRAHSREALMALLWPDEATASAQNNMRVTLSRLRGLGRQIAEPSEPAVDLLVVSRATVQLGPAWAERADVNYFSRLAERTLQHTHAGREQCAVCQADLHAAVQLYRDDLLTGFQLDDCPVFQQWLDMERERVRMLLLDAYADLATYAEAQGDLLAARGYAQRQIELEPLREPAYRQQMRIFAQQGERSAALASFERCRARLHDDLGLDPEPETIALYAQILAGASASDPPPAPAASTRPTGSDTIAQHSLPQPLTLFVGREEELARLQDRLNDPDNRLLSLVGPGGVGKSRLALQLAAQVRHTFHDGVCFVPLAQTPDVESIPAAIAEALGLEFIASHRGPFEQLVTMLADRQLLLVLDNFEHLSAGAGLLVTLLQQAPRVTLVVTSRERLNLQAEDLFELQGLPLPGDTITAQAGEFAALRLFVDRAYRIDKRFSVTTAQLPKIMRICQLVDGFPLAIELAASWARELSCAEIVAELTHGLGQLETTLRDVAPHHRSLRAVFTTSWRLLSDEEQLALQQLAIFRGGFSAQAAGTVAACSPLVLRGLRDKSLLQHAGARRYAMHTLVQQFTAEMLHADRSVVDRLRRDHSRYFLDVLTAQAVALDTRDARTASDVIQADWENIRDAWQWAAEAGAYDLLEQALDGLLRFCNLRGLFQEAQNMLEHAVLPLVSEAARPRLYCRLLTARAYVSGHRRLEQTLILAQQALALAEQLGASEMIVDNLIIQANATIHIADYPQARALADRALSMAQAEGLELSIGICLHSLAVIDYLSGAFERARARFQQVLAIHVRTGRLEQYGREAVGRLGTIASEQGQHDTALRYLDEYLASCEHTQDRRNIVHAHHHLAFVWIKLGAYGRVIEITEQNLTRAHALGDKEFASLGLHLNAWAQRMLGQLDAALRSATESVALARQLDGRLELAYAMAQLAAAHVAMARQEHDWEEATANYRGAAASFRAFGKLVMAYESEIGLAELTLRRGDIPAALEQVWLIIPHLPTGVADGWDEPVRAYLVCAQILQVVGHPLAASILDQGMQLLEDLAQKLADAGLRESFLQAVQAHRELRALHVARLANPSA